MQITLFTGLGYLTAVLLGILLFLWSTYNSFITKRLQVEEDFSDIDVQLKRRATLIEQLVTVVKEYAKHEKETFENVTKARSALDHSTTLPQVLAAENMFTQALRSLFAVAENYPNLKANQNYKQLMHDLKETEDRIAHYRETYNNSVKHYNSSLQVFPNLLSASIFRFEPKEFFQLAAVNVPKVT